MVRKLIAGMAIFFGAQALAVTFDSNVPLEVKNQMIADLEFVGTIEGSNSSAFHREIFGEVKGSVYKEFFESRVRGVGKNSCGGGNAVACVIPFLDPSKMWITDNYIKFSHPQISRLMVVFHEARHTEVRNGSWGHARCPVPFKNEQGQDMKSIWTGALLQGEAACDNNHRGSYGSSTIMLANVSKYCSNCTDKVKMDAMIYAQDQLGRITNAEAKRQMVADSVSL